MALKKFIELHDKKYAYESWCYVADAEADLVGVPDDCQMVFVAAPDSGKSQWRVRKSDGTFVEIEQ